MLQEHQSRVSEKNECLGRLRPHNGIHFYSYASFFKPKWNISTLQKPDASGVMTVLVTVRDLKVGVDLCLVGQYVKAFNRHV